MKKKTAKPAKKSFKQKSDNALEKQPPRSRAAHLAGHAWQPGVSPNPAGRPKGSRNRFAEEFIKDFLADWNEHGAEALEACRKRDVAAYISAAVKILPKDFNINMTSEAELDKFLDQYNDTELQQLLAGLVAVGTSVKKEDPAPKPRGQSDIVH